MEETIPVDMPKTHVNLMSTHCFVDSNHGKKKETRRYQNGVLLFCCMAPIIMFSKRQNTVETSTFGSELTTLKNAVELVESLQYKMCIFGVPIECATNVF